MSAEDEAGADQSPSFMTRSGIRQRMKCDAGMARRIKDTFVTVEQLLRAVESDDDLTSIDNVGPATASTIEEWYENREQREREAKTATVERTSSKSLTIKNNGDWSDALGTEITEESDA